MTQILPTEYTHPAPQTPKRDRALLAVFVLAVTSVVLLMGLLGGILVHVGRQAWSAYDASKAYVLSNQEAISDFGGELHKLDGNMKANISGNRADVRFDVVGPAGSATVNVVAHKFHERWEIDSARYVRDGKEHDISPG